ncbi:MAG: hypothetical protein V1799_06975 [bacterium]
MRCKFPNQTRDVTEQLFYKQILEHFPLYSVFWESYIGVRIKKSTGYLLPYAINHKFNNMKKAEEVSRIHELICMAHYSCFCQLAASHRLYSYLVDSIKIKDVRERHFIHWQLFESAFLHLGVAWQELILLWHSILMKLDSLDENIKISTPAYKVIWNRVPRELQVMIDQMWNEILAFRNDIAHFSRFASQKVAQKYLVPKSYPGKIVWSQQHIVRDWEETTIKLDRGITFCEDVFNETHKYLILELSKILKRHEVEIDYSSGQDDILCPKCSWWSIEIRQGQYNTQDYYSLIESSSGSIGSSTIRIADSSATEYIEYKNDSMESRLLSKNNNSTYKCMNKDCDNLFVLKS